MVDRIPENFTMVVVTEIYANVLLTSELCVELQNGHLVAIQRKIPPENAFEVKLEVTIPLNCKPPASNRTLKTLEHVTSMKPMDRAQPTVRSELTAGGIM